MTANSEIPALMAVVTACEDVILGTIDGDVPDVRHLTNAMNRAATDLNLFFMTGRDTPKYAQIMESPVCCLYYFNPQNRHVVRLYGQMRVVDDMAVRRAHWRDEYACFGYAGPDSSDFILLQFVPARYKFYVGAEMHTGEIK